MTKLSDLRFILVLSFVTALSAGVFGYGTWDYFFHAPKKQEAAISARDQVYERAKAAIYAREGIDQKIFMDEGKRLTVDGVMLHPYRWYSLPENFSGIYFNTDSYGFRMNSRKSAPPARTQIGFFGGSTGFSVDTDDAHAIPALLEKTFAAQSVNVRNYSVGGYSISAELPTFIEVTRRAPMRIAVFYDGVNEVSRYAEYVQDRSTARYYETVGYPYYDAMRDAVANLPGYQPGGEALVLPRRSAKLPAIDRKSIDELITKENAGDYAEKIIQLYLQNVRDISALAKARDITPVFFWQPDLYMARKPLTAEESFMRDEHFGYRRLAEAVHAKAAQLGSRPEMKGITFFDISDALDGVDAQEHFFDFCHVDDTANEHIAAAIAQRLDGIIGRVAH